jgi:multimeric flavodoxin WrbA
MKHVTAFVGSARKRHTYGAVTRFLELLRAGGDMDTELVMLSEHHLGACTGCRLCMDFGEERCPLKDDFDVLFAKIMASDGVVFASPVYSFQVSALMKNFLERMGFALHRPRFFGKTYASIVIEAIYGGRDTGKYLDFVANGLGFNVVKGGRIASLEPMTEKITRKNEAALAALSARYLRQLRQPAYPVPSLLKLLVFRMGRTSIHQMLDEKFRDFRYYRDAGWFTSDYFYPTTLGPVKRLAGSTFDALAIRLTRTR